MDGDGSKVQVYIYDVTKGLAAQLSPMFLGKGWYAIPLCLWCLKLLTTLLLQGNRLTESGRLVDFYKE